MRKRERQATIQRLIQSEPIERQEDLVARLTEMKIPVTQATISRDIKAVSYTHLRAHETVLDLVCRLLLEKKKKNNNQIHSKYDKQRS
ncbi:arginine catabolic regulator [Lactobacillus rhamnosus GG] [Lacticaseibacillus rhamnosus]|nr:arginine catabolic regulator [Lactobacillus rhamnosus GG] [Lacticaseibacillus rhamnosus]